jgi:transposase
MPSQKLSELKELHLARQALIKDRTAAKNREKALTLPLLRRQNETRRRQIESQITAIETAIADRIASDEQLAERCAILESIPGISKITAFALLIEMPELGTLDGKQAASLAGLAPVARQSGRWTGRAFIRGGRASLRQALYMPALVAARFNPRMRDKYSQLIEAGKPAKIAITAIMRKVIVLVNALLREGRRWDEIPA